MRILILSGGLALLAGLARLAPTAAQEFKSGLQPGDRPTPFQVVDVTGPNRGKTICYV